MNRFYKLLLTACLIAVAAWNVSAQVQFSMTPQTINATVNEQVSFEVKVNGFNQVEGYQFTYAFDPTKLEFIGFGPNIASPTLLPTGVTPGIDPTLQSKGKITIVWATPDGQPKTLANGTIIATLLFKSKISGTVAAGFSDDPVAPEVFGPGVDNFPVTFSFSPALNTLGSGGGGGNPCNPDITAPSFGSTCPQNISLTTTTTCAIANWTAPIATDACGNVIVTQIAGLSNGSCFNAGTNTVTYRATDVAGNTALCSFVVDVSVDNGGGTGGNPCVNTWQYPFIGSDLGIVISEEVVEKANDLATVRVMVSNFEKIQGLSFSLTWEASRLQFVGIKDDKVNLAGGSVGGSFNLTNQANGVLGFNWDDPSAVGVTKTNQSVIFEIVYRKLGTSDAVISFSTSPVDINAVKEINGVSVDIQNFTRVGGKVKICSSSNPTPCNGTGNTYNDDLNIKNVVISANGDVCLDVVVNRFTNIDGLEASIIWDASKLQFSRIESSGITLVEGVDWNRITGESKVKISWIAPNSPITLANGEVAFRICFQATGGLNSVANVSFATSPVAEIYTSSSIKQGTTFGNGSVTIKPLPNVTLNTSGICGTTGTLTAAISNASGAYTYIWSGPGFSKTTTTNTVTITTAGIYKVTVQDAACLSGTATTTATSSTQATINSLVQNEQGLAASASSPTYSWAISTNPNAVISTDATFASPQAGTEYILTAGIGGCVAKKNILAIGVSPDITHVKCGGEKTGKIILTITGANVPLNYNWSAGLGASKDVSNLGAGAYSVTITSSDGRVNTVRNFTITEPNPLKIVGSPLITNAPNGAIDVEVTGGTGNLSYNWIGIGDHPNYNPWPTPAPFSGATTQDLTGLEPGTYKLTITDANGCTVTTSHSVNVQPISIVLKDNKTTATTCGLNNGAIELVVKGGSDNYKYIWSVSTVPSVSNPTNLAAGSYSVTVSDLKYNLITVFNNMFILPSDGPIIAVAQVVDAGDNCKGSIDLNVTGGQLNYSYKWVGATANIAPIQDPTNLCEGLHSVTVTDSKGCIAIKTDINVAGAGRPCPVVTKLTQTSCPDSKDGAIDLTVATGKAPYTFVWKKDGKSYNATTEDITNLTIGLYAVTVTDALNKTCEKNDILVSSKSDIKLDATITDPVPNNAKNGALSLIISGGSGNYQYKWEDNVSSGKDASNLRSGTYTVTVTDLSLGCVVVKTFTVGDPASVEIVIRSVFNGVNIRCHGMCNGIGEIKAVDDATPPLKYKWSNGDTSRIAKGLCVGTHKVTVTDANNEIFEGSITLVGPEKLSANISADAASKSAEVTVKGGTSPYNFIWQDKSTGTKITNQEKGRVFVMITDANGCETFTDGFIGDVNVTLACLNSSNPILTPNNDGYNDALDIYCLEKYPINTVQVFNRWGQVVFDKTNYANRTWYGTDFSGKPLPNGPYFYVVSAKNTDGKEEIAKGSFSILNE